jgi:hypothetical protein
MDGILRAAALYVFVWLLVRIAGKRTVSAMNTFDFVLLLMMGEATQQALLGNDFSMTNAFTVLGALVGIDLALSLIKQKFPRLDKWMDGTALIILENGRLLHDRMNRERVDESMISEQTSPAFQAKHPAKSSLLWGFNRRAQSAPLPIHGSRSPSPPWLRCPFFRRDQQGTG